MKTYVVTPHQNRLNETVSNDGSQNMFYGKNMDNYPKFNPVTPFYLDHCC